jgi:glycyl-tRNA synthetase beta chain
LKGEVLEEFMIKEKEAFSLLVTLHKRLKNILINEDLSDIRLDEQKFSHEEERLLFYNYSKKKEEVEAFLKEDKFYAYLKAIAELSQPADDFFKKVYVMVEEITLRKNRLKLLELLYHLISRIGDLSIQQPA